MKRRESVRAEDRRPGDPRTIRRPRWQAALVAAAAAILLLLTASAFHRGVSEPAASSPIESDRAVARTLSTGVPPSVSPPLDGVRPSALRTAGGDPRRRARLGAELERFYDAREGTPAWIEGGRPNAAAYELIEALERAGRDGLEPDDYRAGELAGRVALAGKRGASGRALAALDADLSTAFFAFAADLCCGRLEALPAAERWGRAGELPDLAGSLERALGGGGVAAALGELAPPHPEYRGLAAALTRYRRIADAGGWPEIAGGAPPRPGEDADVGRMVDLAERLRTERYLSLEETARLYRGWTEGGTVRYEEPLVGAVRRFQERHGLLPDAELGAATLRELNVPAAERAAQIAINLERWRFVPRDLGERHIRVNVAGYRLSAIEDGREVLTMPVVVGRQQWETPLFGDRIRYLEVNPTWNVPASIARREILPKAVEDPSYLASHSYQLVDRNTGETIDPATADLDSLSARAVRVRQSPGSGNALGQVKFIFPNRFNVYLHDTPQRSAFERTGRALSHGCVRVERPLELAGFVLGDDPSWSEAKVRSAIASGRSRRIDLVRPLPVYLLYWTVFENAGGELEFRPDVYGHDQRIAASLRRTGAEPVVARASAGGGPDAGEAVGAAG